MRRLAVLAAATVSLAFAGQAAAATYYVSPHGSDAAAGTSQSAPWQTVAKVNAATLAPGDTVLFEGGATFSGLLQPRGSGTSASPISVGSYGTGRADLAGGIQLQSQAWLVIDGVTVDTGAWQTAGTTRGIRTSDSGTGVQNVVVQNCRFANVAIGLLFSNHLDRYWSLSNNVIQYTRDSGILIYDPTVASEVGGSDLTFTGNQILDTGLDTSITYKKHAVYDIGTNLTWRNNVIRNFSEGGFSLRAHSNTLVGNTISGGPYAIYYSPYDSTPGTTTIAYNRISNVTADAVELAASGNVPDVESFAILDNSIVSSGTAGGVRVIGTSGSVALANNLVQTAGGPLLRVDAAPAGGLTERNNLWWSLTPTWSYLGSAYATLSAYQGASGRGAADKAANPQLGSDLVPAVGSPAVDGGTTAIASYVGDCAGAAYHYCNAAPDMGAVELGSTVQTPPPPTSTSLAPPSNLTATSATQSSIALAWTASTDSRVVSYVVSRNGTALPATSGTSALATGLTCGTSYAFSVVALDASGNASSAATASLSTSPCADTTPPSLTVTYPTNAQSVPLTFQITATSADAVSGVKSVTFWFDGNAPCVDTTAPYVSCSITTKQGWHDIRVRATDNAGNYVEKTLRVYADKRLRVTATARAKTRR